MRVRDSPSFHEKTASLTVTFLEARLLRNDKIGTIEIGCCADILILNANPLEDVTVLDRPEDHLLAVIKGGRVVTSKLDDLSAEV